jgi:hypothetical protein
MERCRPVLVLAVPNLHDPLRTPDAAESPSPFSELWRPRHTQQGAVPDPYDPLQMRCSGVR